MLVLACCLDEEHGHGTGGGGNARGDDASAGSRSRSRSGLTEGGDGDITAVEGLGRAGVSIVEATDLLGELLESSDLGGGSGLDVLVDEPLDSSRARGGGQRAGKGVEFLAKEGEQSASEQVRW